MIMYINTQPNIIVFLSIYVVLMFAFYGWGKLATNLFNINPPLSIESFLSTTWVGWSTMLWIMQVIHLGLSITWEVSSFLYLAGFMAGIYGFISSIRIVANGLVKPSSVETIKLSLFMIFITTAAGWAVSRGLSGISNYDSGLYHLNTIRWINSYPIIPGLGNLHDRFAYNQSYFLYDASLNFFPYFQYGYTIANSYLFLLALATILSGLLARISSNSRKTVYRLSNLFGLVLILYLGITSDGMSSPSPDLPSSLIQVILFIWFIDAIQQMRSGFIPSDRLFNILVLATTLITVKLSNLAFAASLTGICVILALPLIRDRLKFINENKWVILIPVIVLLVWMTRGVILSGYPLYPSTIGRVNTDWTMPAEVVKQNADRDFSWARSQGRPPSEVLGNMSWVRPWLSRTYRKYKTDVVFPSLLAIGVGITSFLLMLKQKRLCLFWSNTVITAPIISGLLFWFFTIPEPRLANALFLLLPFSFIVLLVLCLTDSSDLDASNLAAALTLLVLSGFLLVPQLSNFNFTFSRQYKDVIKISLAKNSTASGLVVYAPEAGDQCWDSLLPCTPYFNPMLRLRTSKIMKSGFTVGQKNK